MELDSDSEACNFCLASVLHLELPDWQSEVIVNFFRTSAP